MDSVKDTTTTTTTTHTTKPSDTTNVINGKEINKQNTDNGNKAKTTTTTTTTVVQCKAEKFKIENNNRNDNHNLRSNRSSIITTDIDHVPESIEITRSNTSRDTFSETSSDASKICGWGKIKPKFLQRFCTAKWALFWLCWGGAMQGLIVNGFINVVITTIERRFGLRSRQTGLVASGYDIASFICLVPVTYFGGRLNASKPRWIAWGVVLMGIGSLTFALPRFLVGPYRASRTEPNICWAQDNVSSVHNCEGNHLKDGVSLDADNYTWTVWYFFTAQLLLGAGASPLYTLGVTYIDENVSKKMSSVYLGIYYTMAIMGPAVGYVLGGQLLLIYTDFMTVDAAELGLTSQSNVWIGAWWVGFVFAAAACILLAIPILSYPKSLPGSEILQQEKISEAYSSTMDHTKNNFSKLKELPRALLNLLRNPTFFFLNLAGASEGLIIAGFAAFLPKQIENQFSISPVWSAMLMGLITVPAGGGGTFLGGYFVKMFKLDCSGIIKMCLIVTGLATCFTAVFLLSCPNVSFAGVTVDYGKPENRSLNFFNIGYALDTNCNEGCHCNRFNYDPICGIDGILYYSPCHAGCQQEQMLGDTKKYFNCSCIESVEVNDNVVDEDYDATNTMCQSTCRHLPYFVAICFVLMTFTFLATMPALSATLRCVHDDQRSFALGIQWIKVRLLGTIPAPMIFGALIDETCILWQKSCDDDEAGACLVYENSYMSRYMWLLALTAKLCSTLFFFAAWWFYIPPKHDREISDDVANNHSSHTASIVDDLNVEQENKNNQPNRGRKQQVAVVADVTRFIDENYMNEIEIEHALKEITGEDSGGRF